MMDEKISLRKMRGARLKGGLAALMAAGTFLSSAASASAASDTLVFLTEDVPSGLDIDGPSIAIPTTQLGMLQLFEPLVSYDNTTTNDDGVQMPDFTKPVGRLLTGWEYDEAKLTWTLHVRKGVKGCTGNELTADDLMYTFSRSLNAGGAVPNGWFLLNMSGVKGFTNDVFSKDKAVAEKARTLGTEGIRKIDDYTVEITQEKPNPLLLVNLAVTNSQAIYDSKEMKKHATDADPWSYDYANTVNAPSFGPYCLESWTKNSEFRLKANPDYYRGKAPIDKVIMKKVQQAGNRISILKSGQAQLIQSMTPNQYDSIRKMPGMKVSSVSGNEGLFMVMNFNTPPFDNVKLRQAIAFATPYQRIIDVGYSGQAKQWESVVPSTYPSFIKQDPPYTYDVEKAKALLAEAGFPEGKGLEKYADQFKLTYVAEKETTLGPVVNQIRTALTALNIPVTLDPIPQTQYGDRQIVKKDLAFAINDQEKPIGVDSGYAMQLFFVSKEAGAINNMVNYANPEVDKLWALAKNELDKPKRDAELGDMQKILMRDLTWLPVVEFRTQWAHSDKLQGISWNPSNSLLLYDLHY